MKGYSGTDNLEVMAEAVNYNRFLASLIRDQAREGDRIVDIGAGIGTFARQLTSGGYDVHCIEPDPLQAASIAAAGLKVSAGLESIADASIDFIYTLNVLEHIEDDRAALRQWCDKLRPGGRILIYVPAFPVLFSSMDRKVGHFRRYTRSELESKVSDSGFDVVESRYADSVGFLATLLYKAVGNDSGSINRRALVTYDRIAFPVSRLGDHLLGRAFGKNLLLRATRAR